MILLVKSYRPFPTGLNCEDSKGNLVEVDPFVWQAWTLAQGRESVGKYIKIDDNAYRKGDDIVPDEGEITLLGELEKEYDEILSKVMAGDEITPTEYQVIRDREVEVIEESKERISLAKDATTAPPEELRPAEPEDIETGSVIWYERDIEYGGDFWVEVREVVDPTSDFKAFFAEDGCRYGLRGALIKEVS